MKTIEVEIQPGPIHCPACGVKMLCKGKQSDAGYLYECDHPYGSQPGKLHLWLPPTKIYAIEVDE